MVKKASFSASTNGATVNGTLTETGLAQPSNIPSPAIRAIGPRVTFNYITDEWSSGNTYQYYDVVKVSGVSYIARQNVPTGIDISNTDYWVKWADPNAQFNELQNIVQTFDGRITTAQQSADNAKTAADNAQTAADNASALATRLSTKRKVIALGDSYGAGYSDASGESNTGWVDLLGIILSDSQNIEYQGFSNGGIGLTNSGYLNLLNSKLSEITDKEIVDTVIVCGGFNDHGQSYTNVAAGLSALASVVRSNFPRAKVLVAPVAMICPGAANMTDTHKNVRFTDCEVTNSAWIQCGPETASCYSTAKLLPATRASNCITSDGVHPNDFGNAWIARVLAGIVTGGDAAAYLYLEHIQELQCDSPSPIKSLNFSIYYTESEVIASIPPSTEITLNGATVSLTTRVNLSTQTKLLEFPIINQVASEMEPFFATVKTSDNKYHSCKCALVLDNVGLGLLFVDVTSDGTMYEELQNVTGINFFMGAKLSMKLLHG